MATFLKNHKQILSQGKFDNYSNYIGEILPDNFVRVIGRHRDSDCLANSNYEIALAMLGGESDSVRVYSCNHWAVGWTESIYVDSNNAELLAIAEEIVTKLEDYPILDEEHYSDLERTEADRVWKNCYNDQQRIDYIRDNRDQFEFHNMEDLMGCVRGKYFAGYASELIN